MTEPPIVPGPPAPPPQVPGHPAPSVAPAGWPAPGYGPYPPLAAPSKKGVPKWLWWTLGGIGVLAMACCGVLALLFAQSAGEVSKDIDAARDDVSITECTTTQAGNLSATVHVSNSTSRSRDYTVTVAFVDGNQQLATGFVFVNDLAPGQTSDQEAIGFGESHGYFSCRVTKVSRF